MVFLKVNAREKEGEEDYAAAWYYTSMQGKSCQRTARALLPALWITNITTQTMSCTKAMKKAIEKRNLNTLRRKSKEALMYFIRNNQS